MTPAPYGFAPYAPYPESSSLSKSRHAVLNYLRLLDFFGRLIEKAGGGRSSIDETSEEFRPHDVTYLKLLLLWSYALRFHQFGKSASKWFYIDLLSATGLSYARNYPDDPVPGSCFIVPLATQRFGDPSKSLGRTFNKVFCFDDNPKALAKIEERRTGLIKAYGLDLPEYAYYDKDANKSIDSALDEIAHETAATPRGTMPPLTLVFVDNLGMDIDMSTIQKIQKRIRADLVVHLPTHAVWRCIEAYKKGIEQHRMTAFFGTDEWKTIKSASEIPGFYHSLVQKATGQQFQDFTPVPIQGERSKFHLCTYVRHTSGTEGKDGWVSIIRNLAAECGTITYQTIHDVRAVSSGKQKTLF